MRQHRDLGREPGRSQRASDVRFPGTGALEPGAEAIGLAELEAHVVGRQSHALRVGPRPQLAHALFLGALWRGARAELAQNRLVTLARPGHLPLALARRQLGIEAQRFVDDRQVALVVYETLVGGNLAVDPHPETDVGLEFGRLRDRLGRGRPEQRGPQQQAGQEGLHPRLNTISSVAPVGAEFRIMKKKREASQACLPSTAAP